MSDVGQAIDLVKQLLKLPSIEESVEAKMLIADLKVQLADLRSDLAALRNENTELVEQLRRRDSPLTMTVDNDGLYVMPDGDGPFCTGCFDQNGKTIRVKKTTGVERNMFGKWVCPVCNQFFVGS